MNPYKIPKLDHQQTAIVFNLSTIWLLYIFYIKCILYKYKLKLIFSATIISYNSLNLNILILIMLIPRDKQNIKTI